MAGTEKLLQKKEQSLKSSIIVEKGDILQEAGQVKAPIAAPVQPLEQKKGNEAGSVVKEKVRLELNKLKKQDAVFSFPDQTELLKSYNKSINEDINERKRFMMSNIEPQNELFKKTKRAKNLRGNMKRINKKRHEDMLALMKDRKMGCDEQTWNDLSCFINMEKKEESESFLDSYLGTSYSEAGELQGKDITKALKTATYMIMETDIAGLQITTDEELVKNVDKLENITGMIRAYDSLMKKHPDFLSSLEEDERVLITDRCELLRTLSYYYLTRSDLIDDSYYRSRYDGELSPDTDENSSPDEERVAQLMVRSYIIGNKLRDLAKMDKTDEPEEQLTSQKARELLDKADDETSKEKMESYINGHFMEFDRKTGEDMQQTAYYQNRLKMVFDVDSFLKLMRTDEVLGNVRISEAGIKVMHDIQALQSFLEFKMPPIKLDKKGNVDKDAESAAQEEINNSTVAITMMFNRLSASISAVENTYSDSSEIMRMFAGLRENSQKDCDMFKEKVHEYRSLMISDPAFRKKDATWNDALRHTRAVFYDLDSKDFSVKKDGAGASQVFAITRKNAAPGEGTVYFRKEDSVPPEDTVMLFKEVISQHELSEDEGKKIAKALGRLSSNVLGLEAIWNNVQQMKRGHSPMADISRYVISEIPGLEFLEANANEEQHKKYGQLFTDITDSWFKRNIAQWIQVPAKIGFGRPLSRRNVATSRMATLLGVSNMICDSRTAVVKQNGKLIRGNIMEATGGQETIERDDVKYGSEAISQLFQLAIFDLICGQVDRHFGNFHGVIENGVITQIKGLDNDMAFGNLRFAQVANGYNRIRRVTGHSLTALPTRFINRIMALTPQYLQQVLGDVLEKDELECLWDRVHGIQSNMIKLAQQRKNCNYNSEANRIEYQGEERDDKLRQLKVLEHYIKTSGNKIDKVTLFAPEALYNMNIDQLIEDRRNELQG